MKCNFKSLCFLSKLINKAANLFQLNNFDEKLN